MLTWFMGVTDCNSEYRYDTLQQGEILPRCLQWDPFMFAPEDTHRTCVGYKLHAADTSNTVNN